jgi:hypothetical protein
MKKRKDVERIPFFEGFDLEVYRDEHTGAATACELHLRGTWVGIEGGATAFVTARCETLAEFEERIDGLMDELSAARKEARLAFEGPGPPPPRAWLAGPRNLGSRPGQASPG